MPETQTVAEVSMDEYVKSRIPSKETEATSAATTPTEQVTTAPESAPGTSESEEEKKAKGGGWQRRIDKLTKRNTELEETAKEEREARLRLEAKLAAKEPVKEEKQESGTRVKPKSTDLKADGKPKYADYDEFLDDLTDWKNEQLAAKIAAENKKQTEQAKSEEQGKVVQESFTKKMEAAKAKYSDFDELVLGEESPAAEIVAGSVLDLAIIESEHSGEILYQLCKNPDEIARIQALPPFGQAREIFKLEQSFEPKTSPEPRKAVVVPAPIKPITTSTAKSTVPLGELPMDDYVKARQNGRAR